MNKIKKLILVIDSDSKALEKTESNLKTENFEVIALKDSLQVEKIIKTQYVDAVVCNFLMPTRNGGDILRSIRTNEKRKIPIIITSEDTTIATDKTFEDGTMNFFLKRPIDLNNLCSLINKTLHRFQLVNIEDFEKNEVEGKMTSVGKEESFEVNIIEYDINSFCLEANKGLATKNEEYNIKITCKSDCNDISLDFIGRVEEINHYGPREEIIVTPLNLDAGAFKKLCLAIELKQAYVAQFMNLAKGK